MSRTRIIQIVIVLLFLFLLYKLPQYVRLPFASIDPIEAIPRNSAAFLELSNTYLNEEAWDSLAIQQPLLDWSVLQLIPRDLQLINRAFGAEKLSTKSGNLAIVIVKESKTTFKLLYIVDGLNEKALLHRTDKLAAKEHTFLNQSVYELTDSDEAKMSYAFFENLLIFASHSVLVEDALNQVQEKKTNLYQVPSFTAIYNAACAPDAIHLYLQPQQIYAAIRSFAKRDKQAQLAALAAKFDWVAMEMNAEEDGIALNAKAIPSATHALFAAIQKMGQRNTRIDLPLKLPDNTAQFQAFAVSDFSFPDAAKQRIFENYFKPWIGAECILMMTEPFSESLQEEQFFILENKDVELAENLLLKGNESKKIDYNSFIISQLGIKDALSDVFGFIPKQMQHPYVVVLENMVVFCDNLGVLQGFIDKYTVNQTLENQENFIRLYGQLAEKVDAYTYMNPPQNAHLLQAWMTEGEPHQIKDLIGLLISLNPILLQTQMQSTHFEWTGFQQGKQQVQDNTSIVWRILLEDEVILAPQVVAHKNEAAIITQDASNTLYLINKNGSIIWRRPLEGPIQSEVVELNLYDNKDNFYLFNTRRKVYILDNKGNPINAYPFDLQSPATNGLIAIDFDQSDTYSYFVACENGHIYGFDDRGKPLSGWNPNFSKGRITQDFKHFQYKNKDFIISLNEQSKIQVFQRNGKDRFPPVQLQDAYAFDFDEHPKSTRIVAATTSGKTSVINPEGKHFNIAIAPSAEVGAPYCFADVLGDKRKDYFIIQDTVLYGKYYADNKLESSFSYQYDSPQDALFAVPLAGTTKSYLGSLNQARKQIHLLDEKGELYPDFPLAGTTPFTTTDLFDKQQNILIVGYDKSVYAYQLAKK